MKSFRERAEEKLESVGEQVQNDSLVIRQMTDEESRRYPPRRDPTPRNSRSE